MEKKPAKQEAEGYIRNQTQSEDPQLVRSFRGHEQEVNSVEIDPLQ